MKTQVNKENNTNTEKIDSLKQTIDDLRLRIKMLENKKKELLENEKQLHKKIQHFTEIEQVKHVEHERLKEALDQVKVNENNNEQDLI